MAHSLKMYETRVVHNLPSRFMAYEFTNDDGYAQIAGKPSVEEQAHGKAAEERREGELCSFEELYGDD